MSINPVSSQEEDFSMKLDPQATASKYVIADGTYAARLTDLTKTKSKAGKEMFVWTYVGTEGASEGNEYKDYTLTDPQHQWKIVDRLAAFGVKPQPDGTLPIKKSELIGKRVTIELAAQTFGEGKTSMSVEKVKPPRANQTPGSSSGEIQF